MVGIRAALFMVGIVLVQTADKKAEDDLQAKFARLESQVMVLTQRLDQEEKLSQHLLREKKTLFGLRRQVELLNGKLGNMHPERSLFQRVTVGRSDPDEVAFTAELTNVLVNVPLHTTIKFNHFIHWTDNYYNTSTGVFTCPTSGLYLFAVFIEPHLKDVESVVVLQMDGKPYMSVVSEISYSGQDNMGGNVVLLSVNKGQRVWVETIKRDNQSFRKGYTTFSGVLIHRQ